MTRRATMVASRTLATPSRCSCTPLCGSLHSARPPLTPTPGPDTPAHPNPPGLGRRPQGALSDEQDQPRGLRHQRDWRASWDGPLGLPAWRRQCHPTDSLTRPVPLSTTLTPKALMSQVLEPLQMEYVGRSRCTGRRSGLAINALPKCTPPHVARSVPRVADLLLMHHAGRVKGDKRPLPPCFDASNKENGTFYQCRCAGMAHAFHWLWPPDSYTCLPRAAVSRRGSRSLTSGRPATLAPLASATGRSAICSR